MFFCHRNPEKRKICPMDSDDDFHSGLLLRVIEVLSLQFSGFLCQRVRNPDDKFKAKPQKERFATQILSLPLKSGVTEIRSH